MENFSFTTIVTNLVNRLKLQTIWSAPLFHSVYTILIETVSFGINKLSYLSYSLGIEASWWYATQIKSLIPKTRALGYIPKRNQCPFGSISVSGDPTFNVNYINPNYSTSIPKWTQASDDSGENICFVVDDNIYYKDYVGNLDVTVKVGVPKTYRYTTNGTDSETFYIYSETIDNDELEVFIIDSNDNIIDELIIVERDELKFIIDSENYYCEISSLDDFQGIYIKLGDNVNTNNVPFGSNLLVKYAETNGDEDNITTANTITKFNSILFNTIGVISTLYINQTEALSDGSLSESLEDIKYNAPINFDTAYNLNRLSDYETFPV